MAPVLYFWLAVVIIGLTALPISAALLKRFPDAGAGLTFVIGVVLASYAYFILRVAHILPAGRIGFLAAVVILAGCSAAVAGRNRDSWYRLQQAGPRLILPFVVFTVAFVCYASFRSYSPAIAGTEQPMDLMYVNAAADSVDYPPHDSWLAGERASYYYFGYVQVALLTRVSGVSTGEGYNLGLAYVFAATAAAAVSVVAALGRWTLPRGYRRNASIAAGLALVLLLFVGSVSAVFELLAAHGETNRGVFEFFGVEWSIPCKPGIVNNCYSGAVVNRTTKWYPTEYWFWWRGSRIIPNTITEFPFFSFLLGDLHPHVMSLPLVTLVMALAAQIWRSRAVLSLRSHRRPLMGLTLAVILGALAFQNAWDLLPFTLLFAIAVFVRNLRRSPPGRAAVDSASYLFPILGIAYLAYLPWWLTFSSQAQGLEPYVGTGTRPAHAFLQFGPLLFFPAVGLFWAFRGVAKERLQTVLIWSAWIPLVPLLGWMVWLTWRGTLGDAIDARGTDAWRGLIVPAGGWATLAIYGGLTWLLISAFIVRAQMRDLLAAPLAMCAIGVLLLYGSELFLIRDVFFSSVPRLNTVFKLSYQAWALLAIGGPLVFFRAFVEARRFGAARFAMSAAAILLIEAGLVYPFTAAFNRTDNFNAAGRTIDGLAFVAHSNEPYEYDLVNWITANVPADATVVEASGRNWGIDGNGQKAILKSDSDYTDSGRISARSGRATPIGWYFHEIQWRGEGPATQQLLDHRRDQVDSVYMTSDPTQLLATLHDLGATYVVVSGIERLRYGPTMGTALATSLDPVAQIGEATVYRIPDLRTVPTS